MNLAIDIGNTLAKAAVFEREQVVDTFRSETPDAAFVESMFRAYPAIDAAILVSSRDNCFEVEQAVKKRVRRYIRFGADVPVPVKNLYDTPQTLGCDRLAAAVGANALYPGSNVLIADFGTAITIDIVTAQGEFLGGNISPGATTRFKALHDYTDRLPMGSLDGQVALIGKNSQQAVESGVVNGIVYEIEGYIERFSREYADLRIIFTGGDGNFFAKKVKNPIFAIYDLVVYGLNRILEYNAD